MVVQDSGPVRPGVILQRDDTFFVVKVRSGKILTALAGLVQDVFPCGQDEFFPSFLGNEVQKLEQFLPLVLVFLEFQARTAQKIVVDKHLLLLRVVRFQRLLDVRTHLDDLISLVQIVDRQNIRQSGLPDTRYSGNDAAIVLFQCLISLIISRFALNIELKLVLYLILHHHALLVYLTVKEFFQYCRAGQPKFIMGLLYLWILSQQ